jgi:hypothetical protein
VLGRPEIALGRRESACGGPEIALSHIRTPIAPAPIDSLLPAGGSGDLRVEGAQRKA